jgi:ribosomal protein L11 methylase PrmA
MRTPVQLRLTTTESEPTIRAEPGSFRDPGGRIYWYGERVLRTVMPSAAKDFDYVESSGLIPALVERGMLIPQTHLSLELLGEAVGDAAYLLEHPKLDFISHPYEWPFRALQAAALLQLDLYLAALERDVTLSDATAYNIQFDGVRPVFIDRLSFRRYVDGEFWLGHRQFCEQFLNPLLLRSMFGIPHNAWYRGSPEGIGAAELSALLPLRKKLSWRVLTNVVMQGSLQKTRSSDAHKAVAGKLRFPKLAFVRLLHGLRAWIASLQPADRQPTTWQEYAGHTSYRGTEAEAKRNFVARFVSDSKARTVWDIGCNTGDYSVAALQAGARSVIGFDFDQGSLDLAFDRARSEKLAFTPLFLDVTNPAPDQGWGQAERRGLRARAKADGVLALALIHHVAIAKNVPLGDVVGWLTDMAPRGVIEFVPKTDPMVVELLKLREDIFPHYTEEHFVKCLEERARIVRSETVSSSGRKLFAFERAVT